MCEAHVQDADRPIEVASAGRTLAGAMFAVLDMTCGHCVGTVRAAIEQVLPGAEVAIDLNAHRVTVAGDAVIAAAAIRAAGYTPERIGG